MTPAQLADRLHTAHRYLTLARETLCSVSLPDLTMDETLRSLPECFFNLKIELEKLQRLRDTLCAKHNHTPQIL